VLALVCLTTFICFFSRRFRLSFGLGHKRNVTKPTDHVNDLKPEKHSCHEHDGRQ
jgi:hypothetical protein